MPFDHHRHVAELAPSFADETPWRHLSPNARLDWFIRHVQRHLESQHFRLSDGSPAWPESLTPGVRQGTLHTPAGWATPVLVWVHSTPEPITLRLPTEHCWLLAGWLPAQGTPRALLMPASMADAPPTRQARESRTQEEPREQPDEHHQEHLREPSHQRTLTLGIRRFKALEAQCDLNRSLRLLREAREPLHPRAPQVLALATPEFLHAVFNDQCLFGRDPAGHLKAQGLSAEQLALAHQILQSNLYAPRHMLAIQDTCHALQDVFCWASNSEGPFMFAAKILHLLRLTHTSPEWFRHVWQQHPNWAQQAKRERLPFWAH